MRHSPVLANPQDSLSRKTVQNLRRNQLIRISVLLGSPSFGEGRRVRFYFSHGIPIVHFLAAGWTLMKFQSRDRIPLAMKVTGPLPPDFLNFLAAAGGALRDTQHKTPLRGPSWKR